MSVYGLMGGQWGNMANTATVNSNYGEEDRYSGLLGWVQDKLGLDDQEMRDLLEGAAERGSSHAKLGVSMKSGNPNMPAAGRDPLQTMSGLLGMSKPSKRKRLAVPDLIGLLGMGGPYG